MDAYSKETKNVRHKKCPMCGSRDTAKILYGLPAYNEELENKLNSHTIYLGGCVITPTDPKYHCFSCNEDFGTPPVFISDYGHENYIDLIKEIEISYGGYFNGYTVIKLRKSDNKYFASKEKIGSDRDERKTECELTHFEWQRNLKKLYEGFFLHEWDERYDNSYMDGEQWHIIVKLTNNCQHKIYGSNAYPPYWPEFMNWVDSLKLRIAKLS